MSQIFGMVGGKLYGSFEDRLAVAFRGDTEEQKKARKKLALSRRGRGHFGGTTLQRQLGKGAPTLGRSTSPPPGLSPNIFRSKPTLGGT